MPLISRPSDEASDQAAATRALREAARRTTTGAGAAAPPRLVPIVSLIQTVAQAIPDNAWTALRFDAALVDTFAAWKAATPTQLFVPLAGIYSVCGVGICFGTTGKRVAALMRNSVFIPASSTILPAGGVTDTTPSTPTKQVACQAGDYLQVALYQNTGSPQNTFVGSNTPTGSALDVAWSGPLPAT